MDRASRFSAGAGKSRSGIAGNAVVVESTSVRTRTQNGRGWRAEWRREIDGERRSHDALHSRPTKRIARQIKDRLVVHQRQADHTFAGKRADGDGVRASAGSDHCHQRSAENAATCVDLEISAIDRERLDRLGKRYAELHHHAVESRAADAGDGVHQRIDGIDQQRAAAAERGERSRCRQRSISCADQRNGNGSTVEIKRGGGGVIQVGGVVARKYGVLKHQHGSARAQDIVGVCTSVQQQSRGSRDHDRCAKSHLNGHHLAGVISPDVRHRRDAHHVGSLRHHPSHARHQRGGAAKATKEGSHDSEHGGVLADADRLTVRSAIEAGDHFPMASVVPTDWARPRSELTRG